MDMYHQMPFNTGDKRRDLELSMLRHSGGAWWLMLGMILLKEGVKYASNTELGHIIKRPVQDAAGKAAAKTGNFLLNNSWFIGPGLIAGARLLKKRDTNGCESKLDLEGRRKLDAIGKKVVAGTTDDGRTVVEVKASELLALATLLRTELKNTAFPEAFGGRLTPDDLEKLVGDALGESDIHFDVEMDIAREILEKHLKKDTADQPTTAKTDFRPRPKKKVRGR